MKLKATGKYLHMLSNVKRGASVEMFFYRNTTTE